jgi:N-methylhydantoinase B
VSPDTSYDRTIIRRSGETASIAYASGVAIEPGDEIVIRTASGGGWGRAD